VLDENVHPPESAQVENRPFSLLFTHGWEFSSMAAVVFGHYPLESTSLVALRNIDLYGLRSHTVKKGIMALTPLGLGGY
jgi:hypothetical protein